MAKKSHPYIDAAKLSALILTATILIIVFLAAFVVSVTKSNKTVEPMRVEQNITPPGRLYSQP